MTPSELDSIYLDLDEIDMLKAWSYSRLHIFEKCKKHAKLKYLDKVPEPPRPLPPGKLEQPNERGIRIHEMAERYVKGGVELLPELRNFEEEFKQLRELHNEGKVSMEGEWAFSRSWDPVAWASSDCWLRLKLDAMVRMSDDHAVVIDHKTGKLAGKQIQYTEQMQLYQLCTFLRYPELNRITVELWMLDEDDLIRHEYTRLQGLGYMQRFDKRGVALTTETQFKPNPNMFSCKWCPYNGNACKDGVSAKTFQKKPVYQKVQQTGATSNFVPWD